MDTTLELSLDQQARPAPPLALHIIPPLRPGREPMALEAAMQSLVLDKRHPLALELAGTGERRSFIVRATTKTALDHAEAILRSQYPQMDVRPLEAYEDPFRVEPHEAVSAIELLSGTPSYLPLRTWQDSKRSQEEDGVDPLLGLLAALSKLPEGMRAITQIALVPASANWSEGDLRKGVEHSLDPEKRARQQQMAVDRMDRDPFSTIILIGFALLGGFFFLIKPFLPAWIWDVLQKTLTGHSPHLNTTQVLTLVGYGVGMVVAGIVLFLLVDFIRRIFNPQRIYDMRMVSQKISRAAYRTRLRLYVIGPKSLSDEAGNRLIPPSPNLYPLTHPRQWLTSRWQQFDGERAQEEMRQEVLLRLIASYRQFHMASGAYFIPKRLPQIKANRLLSRELGRPDYGWQQGIAQSNHLVTVDALAALWHMPSASALPDLAMVENKRSRSLLLSPELAKLSSALPPIGFSEQGGYRLPFGLTPQFFTAHTLIAGKSGEGKSTCMEHIAHEAMSQGGLILIDPHGDLCEHILHLVPPSRAEDVVLIDLSDSDASVGINPLDVTLGRSRDKAVSDLLKTLAHIWVSSWGPRMENAFEMSLRTLFEANKVLVAQDAQHGPQQQYTLLDVLPLLTNENFCHAILQQIQDDYLHRWWREYYEPLTLMQQRDIINPVITKAAKFESIIARRIMGQSVSTLNFTEMIAERKIILLKLAKGIVGADVAGLIGATMLGLLQITLEEQGSKDEQTRVRLPIILDEFQVLAGIDYGALAELRKYGATFFLATQSLEYLQKLDELLLPTVLANVKQLITFHLSAKDADTLYKEMGVEQEDIINLDPHICYVKLFAAGRRQPTFSLKITPPLHGDNIQAESIRTRCRVRYTCSVDVIDGMLREAMIRSIRMAPNIKGHSHRGPDRGGHQGNKYKQKPSVQPVANEPNEVDEPDEITPATQDDGAEPRRRRSRGRRGGRRAGKSKDENKVDITPMAFSEGLVEERDFVDSAELQEIRALHRNDNNDD